MKRIHLFLILTLVLTIRCGGSGNTDTGDTGDTGGIGGNQLEADNPDVDFTNLVVGDTVTLNAPNPATSSSLILSFKDIHPTECACTWSISPTEMGSYSNSASCHTSFTPQSPGNGTITVAVDCGDLGSGTYTQDITVVASEEEVVVLEDIVFGDSVDLAPGLGLTSFSGQIGLGQYESSVHLYSALVAQKALYFIKSDDGGTTFESPVEIMAATANGNRNPALDIDANGDIYIAWTSDNPAPWNLYVVKSTDGGSMFSTPVKVNSNCAEPASNQSLSIKVDDSGIIHVAFCCGDGDWQTYYARSTDGGQTFSSDIPLGSGTGWGSGTSPAITKDSAGNLYVAWVYGVGSYDRNVYVARSTDNGENFSDPVRLMRQVEVLTIMGHLSMVWLQMRKVICWYFGINVRAASAINAQIYI